MAQRNPPLTVAQHQAKFGANSVTSFKREPARKTTKVTSAERHLAARALRIKDALLRCRTREQRALTLNKIHRLRGFSQVRKALAEMGVNLKVDS